MYYLIFCTEKSVNRYFFCYIVRLFFWLFFVGFFGGEGSCQGLSSCPIGMTGKIYLLTLVLRVRADDFSEGLPVSLLFSAWQMNKVTNCLLNLSVRKRGQFHTTLPLQNSWSCLACARRLHLPHLCWRLCGLYSVMGRFSSSLVVLILLIIEARTMIFPWLATEVLFKKVWLMSFSLKQRLRCECKWHRFEILCWLLCYGRDPLNERASF